MWLVATENLIGVEVFGIEFGAFVRLGLVFLLQLLPAQRQVSRLLQICYPFEGQGEIVESRVFLVELLLKLGLQTQ